MSQNSCLDLCEVPFQFLEWSFRLFQHMFVSLLIRHQFGKLINFFGVYWCSTCCHESPFSFFTAIMYRGNISRLLQLWELKNVLNIIQIIVLLYHSIGYMSRKILITKLTSLVFRLTILKRRLKIFLCWLLNLLDQHTFWQDQRWVEAICVTKKETKGRRPCAKNTKSELPCLRTTTSNVRFLWTLLAKIRKRVFT